MMKIIHIDIQVSGQKVTVNTEYRNQSRINVHALLPIVFDCRDVISIVETSSKYVGNFDRKSNLTWSFEQVFLRLTDSSKLSQFEN